jgi:hypothetical protein
MLFYLFLILSFDIAVIGFKRSTTPFNTKRILPVSISKLFAKINEDKMITTVLTPEVIQQFVHDLETMATNSAINTAAVYMTEFHNSDTKNWMLNFQDYRLQGFKRDWKYYLESMIVLDQQNMTVCLDPPEGLLGSSTANGGRAVSTVTSICHVCDPILCTLTSCISH